MIEFLCLSRGYFAAPAAGQGSAISALRAAAMRRLRSEPPRGPSLGPSDQFTLSRLRAQCGAGSFSAWKRNQWPRPPSLGPAGQFTLRSAKGWAQSAETAAPPLPPCPPSPTVLKKSSGIGWGRSKGLPPIHWDRAARCAAPTKKLHGRPRGSPLRFYESISETLAGG